jgi:hypothetical protein
MAMIFELGEGGGRGPGRRNVVLIKRKLKLEASECSDVLSFRLLKNVYYYQFLSYFSKCLYFTEIHLVLCLNSFNLFKLLALKIYKFQFDLYAGFQFWT